MTLMRFFGELMATALLVCVGCWGCVSPAGGSPLAEIRPSLGFGLGTMIITTCFGLITGAHGNPSITLACWVLGFLPLRMAMLYMAAQFQGALLGYLWLTLLLPDKFVYGQSPGLCVTVPADGITGEQAFAIEFTLTSLLVLGWCSLWDFRTTSYLDSIGLRIGFLVAACCLLGGPFTGASMNPARTLAPAIFHKNFTHFLTYTAAQSVAAVTTACIWKTVFTPRDM